jgi:hypothetical protein
MNKKFEKMFEKTEEKMASNEYIDFEKSSVNNKPKTDETPLKRTIRIQSYLNKNEYKAFGLTMKPLEKPADRLRKLLLEDIKKRQKEKG